MWIKIYSTYFVYPWSDQHRQSSIFRLILDSSCPIEILFDTNWVHENSLFCLLSAQKISLSSYFFAHGSAKSLWQILKVKVLERRMTWFKIEQNTDTVCSQAAENRAYLQQLVISYIWMPSVACDILYLLDENSALLRINNCLKIFDENDETFIEYLYELTEMHNMQKFQNFLLFEDMTRYLKTIFMAFRIFFVPQVLNQLSIVPQNFLFVSSIE